MNYLYALRKLWLGLRLRCPYCEQGRMFCGLFTMDERCSVCGARYERQAGESIGGTLINLVAVELLTVIGLIATQVLLRPPLLFQIVFWISFNILFVILFYRHARGLWVSISYLSGGVYPDQEDANPDAP
jgi:uncharacterized protein (DUF983 family)